MRPPGLWIGGFAATFALALAACGDSGGGNGTPTGPSETPGTIVATITITAAGAVSPADVTVPVGSRVTFTNNHTGSHFMASDPHPDHTLCPALNQVGVLQPGQSRTSANLTTARVCTYHDHDDETNAALQGTIRVQ
jgi:plastocyanin